MKDVLEEAAWKALRYNTCPYCEKHLLMEGIYHPRFIRNIWRHHITTLHQEDVDADQR